LDTKNYDQYDWANALSPFGNFHNIGEGESILGQGERAKSIGIVVAGRAKAVVYSERGQEVWVGNFKAGDFFGHTSLLTNAQSEYEISAETNMKILLVPAQKFQQQLLSDNALCLAITRDIAARLKATTGRLVEMATVSAPGRVCAEILRLSKPVGIHPGRLIVRPNPVFVELALRVSSTRETVSRTVSGLQKSGIISRQPGAFLIEKPEMLRNRIK